MAFEYFANQELKKFEIKMMNELTADFGNQATLEASMRYSLEAGGKRLRPLLLLLTLQSFGGSIADGYPSAIALELVHTYSLIHDDLPAMDDDDLRRGKPTNHKVFDESTAILAGDALLTKAFEIIGKNSQNESKIKIELITLLAQAAGHNGMIGGQQSDMEAEHKNITLLELESIHLRKTGALLRFALQAAGILTKQDKKVITILGEIADKIGLAYQIRDDILDRVETTETLGKPAGSDIKREKNTYPSLLGIENAYKSYANQMNDAKILVQELSMYLNKNNLFFNSKGILSFINDLEIGR
ncbi:polyprenyl synthetase family protein [Lacticigenium naphthae]|uniref:polyprenyl synthetase family protein n=1 Tax=Lacticigenium naphthae TaxID=515351 RepID=UPI00040EEC9E|nr:farnesyl diphosphate synthase [Lacticigenium naphthae]